jgi:hypothetical protein
MKYAVLFARLYTCCLFLFFSLFLFFLSSIVYAGFFSMTKEKREEKNREGSPSMICLRTSSCDDGYCETQFASNTYTQYSVTKRRDGEKSRERKNVNVTTTAHDASFYHVMM